MAEYYLISQLPSLDGLSENAPLPITEGRFWELCSRILDNKAMQELERLTIIPPQTPEKSASALIEAWNEGERALRLALGKARAEKMNKPFEAPLVPNDVQKTANSAVEIENPLEAERFLLQYRLKFLESLRPMDNFSLDFIFYYGLKLKLLERIGRFDNKVGEATYYHIYNAIVDGREA